MTWHIAENNLFIKHVLLVFRSVNQGLCKNCGRSDTVHSICFTFGTGVTCHVPCGCIQQGTTGVYKACAQRCLNHGYSSTQSSSGSDTKSEESVNEPPAPAGRTTNDEWHAFSAQHLSFRSF